MEKPHKKLDLWNLGMQLVTDVYSVSKKFPAKESYGLVHQLRKAAVSIPSNIAEGAGRQTSKEFIQFLHIAQGSLSELDTQLEISKRLGFLSQKHWTGLEAMMDRIDKMVSGLIRHKKSPHALRLTPHENSTNQHTHKGIE